MENILVTEKSEGYELLDSGEGEKLERYGKYILSRPDPQALWSKSNQEKWLNANATFVRTGTTGKWKKNNNIPEKWQIILEDLFFSIQLLPSKHLGVFPEQSSHWKWLYEKIKPDSNSHRLNLWEGGVKVLNLFGYSGGATMACAKAGASVVHVDASNLAVDLAKKNFDLSGLSDKPVRFIVDDARKFVEREIKRGNKYDIILLEPPVYGKGAKGEIWKIEEDLRPFLSRLKNLLSQNPVAILLGGYSSGYSHITYAQILETLTKNLNGKISSGELAIKESFSGRLLPAGIFARWENN